MSEDISKNLDFFLIDKDYIHYLKEEEAKELGKSNVPNCDYGPTQKEKFVCGIVLHIGKYDYFAPVSSFKEQRDDNIVLYDEKNNPISSVRMNYMFPVLAGDYKEYRINDIQDEKYSNLVRKEYVSVNKQYDDVMKQASKTYNKVSNLVEKGYNPTWACNFKFLEQKCDVWERQKEEKLIEIAKQEKGDNYLYAFDVKIPMEAEKYRYNIPSVTERLRTENVSTQVNNHEKMNDREFGDDF